MIIVDPPMITRVFPGTSPCGNGNGDSVDGPNNFVRDWGETETDPVFLVETEKGRNLG